MSGWVGEEKRNRRRTVEGRRLFYLRSGSPGRSRSSKRTHVQGNVPCQSTPDDMITGAPCRERAEGSRAQSHQHKHTRGECLQSRRSIGAKPTGTATPPLGRGGKPSTEPGPPLVRDSSDWARDAQTGSPDCVSRRPLQPCCFFGRGWKERSAGPPRNCQRHNRRRLRARKFDVCRIMMSIPPILPSPHQTRQSEFRPFISANKQAWVEGSPALTGSWPAPVRHGGIRGREEGIQPCVIKARRSSLWALTLVLLFASAKGHPLPLCNHSRSAGGGSSSQPFGRTGKGGRGAGYCLVRAP